MTNVIQFIVGFISEKKLGVAHTKIMLKHVVVSMVKVGNFGKLVILESFAYFSVSRLIRVKGTRIVQTI